MDIQQEHELKFTVDEQLQAKYVATLAGETPDGLIHLVRTQFGFGDFTVEDAGRQSIVDVYFDTNDFSMDEVQGSLRVRDIAGELVLTYKRLTGREKGEFRRAELNCPLTRGDYESFVAHGTLDFDPLRLHLADLQGDRLVKRLQVRNGRTKLNVSKQGAEYELCLDQYTYYDPDTQQESGAQFEIEIEAKNEQASNRLSELRRQLARILAPNFRAAPASKYHRGLEWIRSTRSPVVSQLVTGSIFLVHGHDPVRHEVARFLESRSYRVTVLDELPDTGDTVIEKLERAATVTIAVVLLTGDDEGRERASAARSRPRARQNVIFELGFFAGRLGRRRVCILHRGGVEIPSDYTGVVAIDIDAGGGWQDRLDKALRQMSAPG